MIYKDSSFKPVELHQFRDDYGTGWTALSDLHPASHILSGHSTKNEVIAHVDESDTWRFDYLHVLANRLAKQYRPCNFDRLDKHLDYGESISFQSNQLKGWVARIEAQHLTVVVASCNYWASHPQRRNNRLFWRDCPVIAPLPTTEAQYQALIAAIDAKILMP